jgi:hypothetical protein
MTPLVNRTGHLPRLYRMHTAVHKPNWHEYVSNARSMHAQSNNAGDATTQASPAASLQCDTLCLTQHVMEQLHTVAWHVMGQIHNHTTYHKQQEAAVMTLATGQPFLQLGNRSPPRPHLLHCQTKGVSKPQCAPSRQHAGKSTQLCCCTVKSRGALLYV